MSKKDYYVEVSLTGRLKIAISAENEEDAKDKIFESLETMNIDVNEKDKEDIFIDEIEWKLIDKMAGGNINEAYIDDFYIEESKYK